MALTHLGLLKTTLLDFPGEVAATVFTSGCNLRCPYCHNPELVIGPASGDEITILQFFDFLEKRKNVLGGICITGGEPLLHEDLKDLIYEIRKKGLKVKLDTNGTFPDRLKNINVDFIAMDLKTDPGKYHLLQPDAPSNLEKRVRESVQWLKSSNIPHCFRTTAVPGIVEEEDLDRIIPLIKGEETFYLSGFRPGKTLDASYSRKSPYPESLLTKWKTKIEEAGIKCVLRLNRERE